MATEFEWLLDGSLCPTELKEARYARMSGGATGGTGHDRRTAAERDYGRLTYSTFLRRLGGVAQIVSPTLKHTTIHNRLTHSLKVSLVAREIANDLLRTARSQNDVRDRVLELGGLDIAACAAAGLAHDFGHSPFGHTTTDLLNRWLIDGGDENGFEGNAQTLRVVGHLDDSAGLNYGVDLTAVTLCGLMKYPHTRIAGTDKFSIYSHQSELLSFARGAIPVDFARSPFRASHRQSLEASIVDLADDITYATHDLEDFIQAGVLVIGPVLDELKVASDYLQTYEVADLRSGIADRRPLVKKAVALYDKNPEIFTIERFKNAIRDTRTILDRILDGQKSIDRDMEDEQQFIHSVFAEVIGQAIATISIGDGAVWDEGPFVVMEPHKWLIMQVMKTVSQQYIIESNTVSMHEQAENAIVEELCDALLRWCQTVTNQAGLPARLRLYLTDQGTTDTDSATLRRAIVDYLCSLTDAQSDDLRRKLTGLSLPQLETIY